MKKDKTTKYLKSRRKELYIKKEKTQYQYINGEINRGELREKLNNLNYHINNISCCLNTLEEI